MSASALSPPADGKRDLDPKDQLPPAQTIRETLRMFTIMGIPFDVLWHHYLRQFYIGPPRAVHTFGVYAFWAGVWYCASHSGDWIHAAIARDREKIVTVPLPAYDGNWDLGTVSEAALANNVPLKREKIHYVAYCSLITDPVFARLTYAYRPWFWQRRLPFKAIWFSMACFTSAQVLAWANCLERSVKGLGEM